MELFAITMLKKWKGNRLKKQKTIRKF